MPSDSTAGILIGSLTGGKSGRVELLNQESKTEGGHESVSCSAVSWEVSHYGGERRGTGPEEGS